MTQKTDGSEPRGTRVAHVGIALRGVNDLLPLLRDLLGLREVPVTNSDGAKIVALEAGGTLVELLESEVPDTPIQRYVTRHGPGIHHIALAVDDLPGTMQKCREAGLRLVDETPRPGAEGKLIAFLHPASTGGVLIELTEH